MSSSPETYNKDISEIPYSNGSQEAMLIQDRYCSPERPSYKDSSKQTPKSILKECINSGSKSKKGIIINETLNETRKLSLKSEASEASHGKKLRFEDQSKRIQNVRPQSATTTSFEAQIAESSHKIKENDQYKLDGKRGLGSNWTLQAFNKTETTRNSNQELSDFQKAYLRNQQREREQEIYCEMTRRSNAAQEKDENYQSEDTRKSVAYEENKHLLKNLEQKRRSLDNQDSKRSLQSLSSIGYVEEKIQQLERCLDVYSNRLRDSIIRQRDQLLASHYGKTGNIEKNHHDEPLRSWEGKESLMRKEENEKYYPQSQKNKSRKSQENVHLQAPDANLQSSGHWEGLDYELDQLRQENNSLKSKLPVSEKKYKSISKRDEKYLSGTVLDKEMELLKTVDQIRAKLYNSISKRTIQERMNQSSNTDINVTLKSDFKKNKTRKRESRTVAIFKKKNLDIIPPKNQKVREAYGEKVLERENACILNQGLSTTYNGFHWNADQSLKITRNV